MPVIGIDQVPRELQRPSFLGDIGYSQGVDLGKIRDAILAAAMASSGGIGQVPTQPTPGNPGQMTFPSGAQTTTSPLEQAQIAQLGGVPTRSTSSVGPTQQLTSMGQGGITYAPPTHLWFRPDVKYQLEQQKLETERKNQAFMDAYAKSLKPWDATAQSDNEFIRGLAALSTKAQAGDEDAVSRIRMIRQLMSGQ